MKSKITQRFTLFFIFLLGGALALHACNLSQISTYSVVPEPFPSTDTTITIQVCFGGGVTGTTDGADGDTRTFAFGWYDVDTNFSIVSYLPTSVTGGFTGCTMPGSDVGALAFPPYYTQGTILYVDPAYYGDSLCSATPFTCVTSTANCGNVSQQCVTFTFVVNQIPDSMRIFGVEGGGNAIAGCYPDLDMLIDFTSLPVEWGPMEIVSKDIGIELQWSTYQEANSDIFIIEREVENGEYKQIGVVNAAGNSNSLLNYAFVDHNPNIGANRYRLVQIDRDGTGKHSQVLESNFEGAAVFSIVELGPVPCENVLRVGFYNPTNAEVIQASLINIKGATIDAKSIEAEIGGNEFEFDVRAHAPGIYFLRLESNSGTHYKKFIKS